MFDVRYYSTDSFGTTPVFLEGGDFMRIVSSSVNLNLTFYGQSGETLANLVNMPAGLGFRFRRNDGGQRPVVSPGGGIIELPAAFSKVKITAASTVTPLILIANGIDADSALVSVIASTIGAGSVSGAATVAKSDTQTLVIAANSARRDLRIVSQDDSATGVIWTGGNIYYGLPLNKNDSITYANYTGALTLYSEGSNTICYEEILN